MPSIRIVVLEDNRLLGTGAAALLSGQSGVKAVAVGVDGEGFLARIRMVRPQIVLFRLCPNLDDSFRILGPLKETFPRLGVVVLGTPRCNAEAMRFMERGVAGFVASDAAPAAILRTIRAVASGKTVLPAPVVAQNLSELVGYALKTEDVDELADAVRITRREQDIVDRIASGRSNREIALELNIAVHTVKSHVHHILEKLALNSRLELAVHALAQRVDTGGAGTSRDPRVGASEVS